MKTLHFQHQMFRTSKDGTPLIWNQILAHLNLDDPLKHHPTEIRLSYNSAEVYDIFQWMNDIPGEEKDAQNNEINN